MFITNLLVDQANFVKCEKDVKESTHSNNHIYVQNNKNQIK